MKVNVYQKFILFSVATTIALVVGLNLLISRLLAKWLLEQEGRITAEALYTVTSTDLRPPEFARITHEGDTQKFLYIWQRLSSIPEVFRAKIYDGEGRIVWSDEPRLIGKVYEDNEELQEALEGHVEVEMGEVKAEHEFETDSVPEGELLEIYVPLISRMNGVVYGVVEIYKHPGAFLRTRRSALRTVWGAGTAGGVMLFLALVGLFRGAWREQLRLQEVERQYAEVELEMKVAGKIQTRLLPASMPDVPGFSLAAYHQQSRQVGGDYYDVFTAGDEAVVLSVADSEGKGVPGALVMVEMRRLLRSQMAGASSVKDAILALNASLSGEQGPARIVTMFLAKLGPSSGGVSYCNAGHCPALLLHDGEVARLSVGGVPMGVLDDARYEEGTAQLAAGDVLLLYTDGVTEAWNAAGELFGTARLEDVLRRASSSDGAGGIVTQVRAAVAEFSGGQPLADDATVVCVAANAAAAPA